MERGLGTLGFGQVLSLLLSPSQCRRTFSYKYQALSGLSPGGEMSSGSLESSTGIIA